jgi:hypothetical protein
MRGILRIFRTKSLETSRILEFTDLFLIEYGKVHLLLSDGIILDLRSMFDGDQLESIFIQRILTSYQLEKILMDSDDMPFYMIIRSEVISDWKKNTLEGIYDILKIKTNYRGCNIWMNIVGNSGTFEKYLGEWRFHTASERKNMGIYAWEDQPQR